MLFRSLRNQRSVSSRPYRLLHSRGEQPTLILPYFFLFFIGLLFRCVNRIIPRALQIEMLSKFIMDLSHFIILIFLLFNYICIFSLSLASFLQPYMAIFFFFSFMINIDNIGTFISLFLFLRSQCI